MATATSAPRTIAPNAAPASAADTLRAQTHLLIETVDAELINRFDAIEVGVLGLLSRSHVYLLGQPGTGKTAMIDLICRRIVGARQFAVLLGKLSSLEDVMGPLSLTALKDDRYHRIHAGYLPDAHVAKIDEVFKGSTALLNQLLGVLNERTVRDDGMTITIPLSTVFGASNELPQQESESLAAIYDRFLLRLDIDPLTEAADIEAMLRMKLSARPAPPVAIMDWADMVAAQELVAAMPVSDATLNALIEVVIRLRKLGIEPSNRRQVESLSVVKAAAWLEGAAEAQPHHLEVLVHCYWDVPTQRREVERTVLEVCSPARNEAIVLADEVGGLSDYFTDLMVQSPDKRFAAMHEINTKLGKASVEVDALLVGAGGRALKSLTETQRQIEALSEKVLTDGFGIGQKKARSIARRNGNGTTP